MHKLDNDVYHFLLGYDVTLLKVKWAKRHYLFMFNSINQEFLRELFLAFQLFQFEFGSVQNNYLQLQNQF